MQSFEKCLYYLYIYGDYFTRCSLVSYFEQPKVICISNKAVYLFVLENSLEFHVLWKGKWRQLASIKVATQTFCYDMK